MSSNGVARAVGCALLWLGLAGAWAVAQSTGGSLHHSELTVTAFSLRVEAVTTRLPAGIPARVRTRLEFPAAGAAWVDALRDTLRRRYRVEAELYPPAGQAGAPVTVRGVPGDELVVPGEALAVDGRYRLVNIRLVSRTDGRTFLYAEPSTLRLDIGGDVFVAWVESRPLDAAELAAAGVVYDENSWTNYGFTLGLELESGVVEYRFPSLDTGPALPLVSDTLGPVGGSGDGHLAVEEVSLDLSGFPLPTLPGREVRLPGLLVIPGNVGFLNQHVEAVLFICNALPPESGARLEALTAEAELPAAAEVGPGDPLSLAPVETGTNTPLQDVSPATGAPPVLAPGTTGRARWIIRGHTPGYHEFDIAVHGRLVVDGEPGGWPVGGTVRGGVAVRENPRFSLTFVHPDRVEAGAEYDVAIHVTNVSATPAHGFRLAIDEAALTGVDLLGLDTPADNGCPDPGTYCRPELAPGETVVLTGRFRSRLSGSVTATYAGGDAGGLEVGVRLIFGVDRHGRPMNPDTLVLPPVARGIDDGVIGTSVYPEVLAFLGTAHTLSVTPPAQLSATWTAVDSVTVRRLADALTEAGLARLAGMDRSEAIALFYGDVIGLALADDGLRSLLETREVGDQFRQALAAALGTVRPEDLADRLMTTSGATGQVAAVATDLETIPDTVSRVELATADGGVTWAIIGPDSQVSFRLPLGAPGGSRQLALFLATPDGHYTRHEYGVDLQPGDWVRLPARTLSRIDDGLDVIDGASGAVTVVHPRQTGRHSVASFRLVGALKVNPAMVAGADPFGRNVFCVFNRALAMTRDARAGIRTGDGDTVLLARPLASGRIMGLVLDRPVGRFRPPTLVTGAVTATDGAMIQPGEVPVRIPDTMLDSPPEQGVTVEGQVLYPSGQGVNGATIELYARRRGLMGDREICISRITARDDGTFEFPFLPLTGRGWALVAVDPQSGARRRYPLRLEFDGQQLRPVLVMHGTGSLVGEVVDESGQPLDGVLSVLVDCRGDGRKLTAALDGGGRFHLDGVAVGDLELTALLWGGSRIRGTVCLEQPGDTVRASLISGRTQVSGTVLEDVSGQLQPVPGARVRVSGAGSQLPFISEATAGIDGEFHFTNLPAGDVRLTAVHPSRNVVMSEPVHLGPGETIRRDLVFTQGVRLVGQVVTRDGNGQESPTAFAVVRLSLVDSPEAYRLRLQTDGNGQFVCESLPVGFYQFEVSSQGQAGSTSRRIRLADGENRVQLVLPGLVRIIGQVLQDDGTPAAGARLIMQGQELMAGPDGYFDVAVLPGSCRIVAQLEDQVEVTTVEVHAGDPPVMIQLRGRRRISGRVVVHTATGEQPVSVPLQVEGFKFYSAGYLEYERNLLVIRSGPDGGFYVDGIPDGPFAIGYAGGLLYRSARISGILNGKDLDGVVLTLGERATGGILRGVLLESDGTTPVRAGIRLTVDGGGLALEARTDDTGCFEFPVLLQPTHYVIRAEDPLTGSLAWQEIVMPASGDLDVRVRMLGQGTARIRVMNTDGTVLDGEDPAIPLRLTLVRQGQPPMERVAGSVWETDYVDDPTAEPAFVFTHLVEGHYIATVKAQPADAVITTSGGVSITGDGCQSSLDLVLAPSAAVTGIVHQRSRDDSSVDSEPVPVPNAEVSLYSAGGKLVALTVSSGQMADMGRFELHGIPAGAYRLEAVDYGNGRRAALNLELHTGENSGVTILLEDVGQVEGVVVSGEPGDTDCSAPSDLSGVEIILITRPGEGSAYQQRRLVTRTGVDGRFRFAGIPSGRISLEAVGADGNRAKHGLTLEEGATACVVLGLEPVYTVSGRVVSPDGATGVDHARVQLRGVDPTGRTQSTLADGEGVFELTGVLAGEYTLMAGSGSGVNRSTRNIDVHEDLDLTLMIKALTRLGGNVMDHSGTRVVPAATVTFSTTDMQLETVTDDQGQFLFPEVPVGSFHLDAWDSVHDLHGILEGELSADSESLGAQIFLEPSFDIAGILQDENGSPVSAALVRFHAPVDSQSPVNRQCISVENGSFFLEQVALVPGWLDVSDGDQGRLHLPVPVSGVENGAMLDLGILTLDQTPPGLEDLTFWSGQHQYPSVAVGLDARLILSFTEEMDPASLTRETIRLRLMADGESTDVGYELQSTGDGIHFEIRPDALLPDSAYRLWISPDIVDHNGISGEMEIEITFQTVDTVPPEIVEVSPFDGSIEVGLDAPVQIRFSEPIDAESGAIGLQRDGAEMAVDVEWSEDGTTLVVTPVGGLISDARYRIRVSGWQDGSGNVQVTDFEFGFDTRDTQPPVVTADFCGNNFTTSDGQPILSLQFSDALRGLDVSSVRIVLQGEGGTVDVDLLELSPAGARCRPVQPLTDGEWTCVTQVSDPVGNTANLECSFTMNRSRIEILGHLPDVPLVVDDLPVPLEVSFLSTNGVRDWEFRVDGEPVDDATLSEESGTWYLRGAVDTATDGIRYVDCRISDETGYQSPLFAFEFVWDGQPPAITISSPDSLPCTDAPTIGFRVTDEGAGIDPSTLVMILDGTDRSAELGVSGNQGTWTPSEPLPPGDHTLELRIADRAGHDASSKIVLQVDDTPPEIVVRSPYNNEDVTNDAIRFEVEISDNCALDTSATRIEMNGQVFPDWTFREGRIEWELPWDDPRLGIGDNRLTVSSRDHLGNERVLERMFRIVRTVNLPTGLVDGNEYEWDIDGTAAVRLGGYVGVTVPAAVVGYDGSEYRLAEQSSGQVLSANREIAIRGELGSTSLLQVRRIMVSGGGYYLRIVDSLKNHGSSPVSVTVRQRIDIPAGISWSVVESSSGQLSVLAGQDWWLVLDDDVDMDDRREPNLPAIGLFFGDGQGVLVPDDINVGASGVELSWSVEVPAAAGDQPGEIALVLGVTPQPIRREATSALERLIALPEELFSGLREREWDTVVNLDLLVGPDLSLPSLPHLCGELDGRLVDGTPDHDPVTGRRLLLRSQAPLYTRCREAQSDSSGWIQFPANRNNPGLPLTFFDVLDPCVPGWVWTAELTESEPELLDQSFLEDVTGGLRVWVRTSQGDLVRHALVTLSGESAGCEHRQHSGVYAVDDPAAFSGLAEGTYALTVECPFGRHTREVEIVAGVCESVEITLDQRFLSGRIHGEDGLAVEGAQVVVSAAYNHGIVYFQGTTDVEGRFIFPDPPADLPLDIVVVHSDGRWCRWLGRTVSAEDSLILTDQALSGESGALRVRVETMTGEPVAGADINLIFDHFPMEGYSGITADEGETIFPAVPAYFPGTRLLVTIPGVGTLPWQELTIRPDAETVRLFTTGAGNYSIRGRLTARDGVFPAGLIRYGLRREIGPGVYDSGTYGQTGTDGSFTGYVFLPTGRAELVVEMPASMQAPDEVIHLDATQATEWMVTTGVTVSYCRVQTESGESVTDACCPSISVHDPDAPVVNEHQVFQSGEQFTVLGLMPDNTYDVSVLDGEGRFYCTTFVTDTDGVTEDIAVVPCASNGLSGTLLAADGETLLINVTVDLEREVSPGVFQPSGRVWTDATGRFRFANLVLPTGKVRLGMRLPSSQGGGCRRIEIDATEEPEISWITEVSVVRGQAVDELGTGTPLSRLDVCPLGSVGDGGPVDVRLGTEGVFTVLGLKPGVRFELSGRDESAGFHATIFSFPAENVVCEGVSLPPANPTTITGTLLAADGQTPVPTHPVSLEVESAPGEYINYGHQILSGPEGTFIFPDVFLPTGGFRLAVSNPPSQEGEMNYLAGQSGLSEDISFVTGISLALCEVLDSMGQPVLPWETRFVHMTVQPEEGRREHPEMLFDGEGNLVLLGLCPGISYNIRLLDENGHFYSGEAILAGAEPVLRNVIIREDRGRVLSGRLLAADGQTHVPVTGLYLEREMADGSFRYAGLVEEYAEPMGKDNGAFIAGPLTLPTGRVRLVFPHPFDTDREDRLLVDFGEENQMTVDFTTTVRVIIASVTDPDGEPIAIDAFGVIVLDETPYPLADPYCLSASDGRMAVVALPVGTPVQLVAYSATTPEAMYTCTVELNQESPVSSQWPLESASIPGVSVDMLLMDPWGRPMAGEWIRIEMDGGAAGMWKEYMARSDDDGRVRLTGVIPGRYTVRIVGEMGNVDVGLLGVPVDAQEVSVSFRLMPQDPHDQPSQIKSETSGSPQAKNWRKRGRHGATGRSTRSGGQRSISDVLPTVPPRVDPPSVQPAPISANTVVNEESIPERIQDLFCTSSVAALRGGLFP